jgi:hypothetical protein
MINLELVIKVILGTAGSVTLALGVLALAFFIVGLTGWGQVFVGILVVVVLAIVGALIYTMTRR